MGFNLFHLGGIPPFVTYFIVGGLLTVIFTVVYIRLTNHDELALIRAGNTAAAIALSGNLLGFSIPLDKVISQSASIPECLLWALAAAVVQWSVYVGARLLVPDLSSEVARGNTAVAVQLAAFAIVAGMLNSAAMAL
jgi:putative membrane protein